MSATSLQLIEPQWPAPDKVRALSTTRVGGYSQPPFDSFNLGAHVADDPVAVAKNRALLQHQLGADVAVQWLNQVHGVDVARLQIAGDVIQADAAMTAESNLACLVMTADCLPVLFCNRDGSRVAAAHAGWRGLVDGVLENTLAALAAPADQVLCWLGPAIGPAVFEVGAEVRERFCSELTASEAAFVPSDPIRKSYLADIYQLARLRLQRVGVSSIYGGERCTYDESEAFFSYRRDGQTGRMASLIWIEASN